MDIKLIKCPHCNFTMKEPTLVQGKHVIVGHDCNGFKVPNRQVGDDSPIEKLTKVVTKDSSQRTIEKLSDRQLIELQTQTLIEISKNTSKTQSIINFFFWIYIIGLLFWIISIFI
ncbi:hypothetical protein LCM02_11625 [Lutimonas saemankumensis]|uniref:hypothetical protein n=1 Tax=Lutimonas saemankumensis TaxID=483016 RepID=UPI001CD68944|nr:hypothetical protein [Lutimonas saemankumensis]MCA0933105.1 hypothetical protein [Lutimonas saemankumensis]